VTGDATDLTIVGLGGSLAETSRSRAALLVALEGAEQEGAGTRLLDLRALELPMYDPDVQEPGETASQLMDACYGADGLIWSSPLYQGTVSGAFKNALDWLHDLGLRDPPFLHDKVIGLISASGGTHGLQAINTMEFSVRALRAWAVPYVVPVATAWRVFGTDGQVEDETVKTQLQTLGTEVVRVAGRFAADAALHRHVECTEAAERVAAAAA
jgi:FMN reductase